MSKLLNRTYNNLEIRYTNCSGVSTVATDTDGVEFYQGTFSLEGEFKSTKDHDLLQLMSDNDVYRVDVPLGEEGGLILGEKVTRMQSLFLDISKLPGVIAVSKTIKKGLRFNRAIDYLSRMNIAISGEGYQVALLSSDGKVHELFDHIADMDDVEEVGRYLDELAKKIGSDGDDK
jgi:hypothetical protein